MKKLLIAALLVSACKKPDDSTTWTGIPDDPSRTCAWNKAADDSDDKTGTCIVFGQAYSCVYDGGRDLVACAKTSMPATVLPESGK